MLFIAIGIVAVGIILGVAGYLKAPPDTAFIVSGLKKRRIIIGKAGSMLKKIGMQARTDIEDLVEMQVNLQLWVKVKKDWRDSDFLMKNFGYNLKDGK